MPAGKSKPPQLLPSGGRLVGYARVSTADQNPQMQIDALAKAGVSEENIWWETASGVARNRPALAKALADARDGDILVVWKLDRVGRSLLDLLGIMKQLEENGVGFKSLTEGIDTTTPAGRLILHVIGALAQFERDLIVERTRAGVKAHRERGGKIGQPLKMTPERLTEAVEMIKDGTRVKDVATFFNVSPATIYNHLAGTITALRDEKRRKITVVPGKRGATLKGTIRKKK
jgi:DNA invertase Pin-like site-specific DNA recombinase